MALKDINKTIIDNAIALQERNKELEECVHRANIFFEDVMPQIGKICLQDYENMNFLGLLLTKLRKEKK